jgi:hypothetical protein
MGSASFLLRKIGRERAFSLLEARLSPDDLLLFSLSRSIDAGLFGLSDARDGCAWALVLRVYARRFPVVLASAYDAVICACLGLGWLVSWPRRGHFLPLRSCADANLLGCVGLRDFHPDNNYQVDCATSKVCARTYRRCWNDPLWNC